MTTARDFAKAARAREAGPTVLDLLVRLRALVDASDAVVANWSEGDLAGSVNLLEESANDARKLLEHKGINHASVSAARALRV